MKHLITIISSISFVSCSTQTTQETSGLYGSAYVPVTRNLPKVRDVEIRRINKNTTKKQLATEAQRLIKYNGWKLAGTTRITSTEYSPAMIKSLARSKGADTVLAHFTNKGLVSVPTTTYVSVPQAPTRQYQQPRYIQQQYQQPVQNNYYSPYPYVNTTNTAQGGLLDSLSRWNSSRRAVTTYRKQTQWDQDFIFLRSPNSKQ